MTIEARKKLRKVFFPVGIFFLIFTIEAFISLGSVGYYFIDTGKARLTEIKSYTKNYSMTMAEAFADVAELSLKSKKYSTVKRLFQEKIRENTIDEAFFVLTDGTVVVHSNRHTVKELRGNLSNDEFTYNLDMILMPARQKTGEVIFSDYNIVEKRSPFKRRERQLIEKYLSCPVDSTGWLVTRAVYRKKKPAGAVSFIISKERIFTFIKEHTAQCRAYLEYALFSSLGFAFLVSLIVFFRYRWIQQKTARHVESQVEALVLKKRGKTEEDEIEIIKPEQVEAPEDDNVVTIELEGSPGPGDESQTISLDDLVSMEGAGDMYPPPLPSGPKRKIQEPIPLSEKEVSNDFH